MKIQPEAIKGSFFSKLDQQQLDKTQTTTIKNKYTQLFEKVSDGKEFSKIEDKFTHWLKSKRDEFGKTNVKQIKDALRELTKTPRLDPKFKAEIGSTFAVNLKNENLTPKQIKKVTTKFSELLGEVKRQKHIPVAFDKFENWLSNHNIKLNVEKLIQPKLTVEKNVEVSPIEKKLEIQQTATDVSIAQEKEVLIDAPKQEELKTDEVKIDKNEPVPLDKEPKTDEPKKNLFQKIFGPK